MVEFFHLNPKFFPESTRDHFPLDTILRLGALPLGTKHGWRFFRKVVLLNVGLIAPKHRATQREIQNLIREKTGIDGIQFFRIDPGEFLGLVETAYAVKRERLEALPENALAAPLRDWLKAEAARSETP